jgi:hypothetical protein
MKKSILSCRFLYFCRLPHRFAKTLSLSSAHFIRDRVQRVAYQAKKLYHQYSFLSIDIDSQSGLKDMEGADKHLLLPSNHLSNLLIIGGSGLNSPNLPSRHLCNA